MLIFGMTGFFVGSGVYYVLRKGIQDMPVLTKRKRSVRDLFYGYFYLVGFIAIIFIMIAAVWSWESAFLNSAAALFGGAVLGGVAVLLSARFHRSKRKRKKTPPEQQRMAA